MKKILLHPLTNLISRAFVGFIFLAFGLSKIAVPEQFAKEIANYALLPEFSLNIFALILPWIELIIGILLILGVRLRANAIIGSALMVIFILMVGLAWARGLDISCGCSSAHPQKVGLPKILENTGLLILLIISYISPNNQYSLEHFASIK